MKPQSTLKTTLLYLGTFVLIFIAAQLGQYLFYEWNTSPAILWPPTGIAFAIIWFGGYRYALPAFFALFTSSLLGPEDHLLYEVFITSAAQVIAVLLAKYALHRIKFEGSFSTVRDVLKFLLVILSVSLIAPSISTLVSSFSGTLTVSPYISWSRLWAGHIFSLLILSPLILTWAQSDPIRLKARMVESGLVGAVLVAAIYLLFWKPTGLSESSNFGFLFFSLLFVAHIWVSFRFSARMVTLALFVTTVIGISGVFLSPDPEQSLHEQLFAMELLLFFIAPIFYAFSALVKERAKSVADLEAAMNRIERENVLKNNFITVLAHELRNPLAPVKTTLDILGEMNLDLETQKLVKDAHFHIHAMRRLLDDLLDVTRVTQGKFELQIESSQLCSMIEHSITSTKSLFDKGHEYIVSPCDETIWIDVDPVRFEQALVNILNNAGKYTNPGGRIELTSVLESDCIKIIVKDNGVGMSPETLNSIFEPFWQAKEDIVSGSGVGIGLSLTKHIIKLHKGTIRAESGGYGQGSTFTLTFPLSSGTAHKPYVKNVTFGPIPKRNILVVDDNRAAANTLNKLLTLKGHEVRVAYSGKEAFLVEKEFKPNIILLDIGLPDMTGYEVAHKLRIDGYKNKIVALSGYGQKEDKDAALAAGCDLHITKPMSIERLEEFIVSTQAYGRT